MSVVNVTMENSDDINTTVMIFFGGYPLLSWIYNYVALFSIVVVIGW